MTPEQFEDALDRYGNDIDAWPSMSGDAARRLMASSSRAAAMWRQATRIEAFMRAHDPGLWIPPEQVLRVSNAVMARIGRQKPYPRPLYLRMLDAFQFQVGTVNWVPRLAASMMIGLMVGLVVGASGLVSGEGMTPFDLIALSDTDHLVGL